MITQSKIDDSAEQVGAQAWTQINVVSIAIFTLLTGAGLALTMA